MEDTGHLSYFTVWMYSLWCVALGAAIVRIYPRFSVDGLFALEIFTSLAIVFLFVTFATFLWFKAFLPWNGIVEDEMSQEEVLDPIEYDQVEEYLEENMEWPQYYVSGENVDAKDFVPAYYKVEGPNGPVSYVNPNYGPYPSTMYDFAMEAQADNFRYIKKEETPWDKIG